MLSSRLFSSQSCDHASNLPALLCFLPVLVDNLSFLKNHLLRHSGFVPLLFPVFIINHIVLRHVFTASIIGDGSMLISDDLFVYEPVKGYITPLSLVRSSSKHAVSIPATMSNSIVCSAVNQNYSFFCSSLIFS